MFRFAHPEYLLLGVAAVILIIVFLYGQKKRRTNSQKWGNLDFAKSLAPNVSYFKTRLKFYFQIFAFLLLVVVIAQPQFGTKEEIVKKKGIEVMIALDVSNSMLAQDVQPNRLAKAKQIISKLVDKMDQDRVGMIVFAGDAYVQLPITTDFQAAKMFLTSINPSLVPRQGTAVGSAIDLAIKSFSDKKDASRAIVVLTDAENHEDDALAAAKLAYEKGIKIFVVGLGTPSGAPIPIGNSLSFKKDSNGNVVVTKLNEELAKNLAQVANGVYTRADNSDKSEKLISKSLDKLAKTTSEEKVFSQYNEQFQSFAIIALIILIIEFFIYGRKNKVLSKIRFFDIKK